MPVKYCGVTEKLVYPFLFPTAYAPMQHSPPSNSYIPVTVTIQNASIQTDAFLSRQHTTTYGHPSHFSSLSLSKTFVS